MMIAVLFVAVRSSQDHGPDGGTQRPSPTNPAESTTTSTAPPAGDGRDRDDRAVSELLVTLRVTSETSQADYQREAFGEGWRVDSNGCDVRDRVLAEESRVRVVRDADGCAVLEGQWLSLYDGYRTTDPAQLEIDHLVPLAEAWVSGAAAWSADQRERYANDLRRPDALLAVSAASNQSKSDGDPAEWMPPNRDAWCRYAAAWVRQKSDWHLTVDRAEHDTLSEVLATC